MLLRKFLLQVQQKYFTTYSVSFYFLLENFSLEFGQHLAVHIYNFHLRYISHRRNLEDLHVYILFKHLYFGPLGNTSSNK
jgi:hypothetical protein